MKPQTLLKLSAAFLLACFWLTHISTNNTPEPGKFGVLVVTDNSDPSQIDQRQVDAVQSTINRDYLDSHCDTSVDETTGKSRPDYRILDKTARLLQEDNKWSQVVKDYPPPRYPWVYLSTGKAGTQGDVRLDYNEQGEIYRKWGGP